MTKNQVNPLPDDLDNALLVGRVWRPESDNCAVSGPAVVAVRRGRLVDITRHAATVADLFEHDDMLTIVRSAEGEDLGDARELVQATQEEQQGRGRIRLLAPCDLQAIKAAGVTFAVSLLERVIE